RPCLIDQRERLASCEIRLARFITGNDREMLTLVRCLFGKPFPDRRRLRAGAVDRRRFALLGRTRRGRLGGRCVEPRRADAAKDPREVGQRRLPSHSEARDHAAFLTESAWRRHEVSIAAESQPIISSRARSSASARRAAMAASGAKTKLAATRP